MSRRIAALALLLATALAGCSDSGTYRTGACCDTDMQSPQQRASEVVKAWTGSAEEKVWRTGYYPLDSAKEWLPKDAFHSGADKFAFWSGHLDLKVLLPASGPTGEVVWQGGSARMTLPLLSADQVFRGLTENKPPCNGACDTRLSVTAVKAGTRTVATSRGQATAPVWEFTVAGYTEPFAYPAVAPQQPPRPAPPTAVHPSIPDATGASWTGTSKDGLTLTGMVGHGDCDELLPSEVYETDDAVVLIAHTRSKIKPGVICDAALRSGPATFRLTRPLGNRVVLNLISGAPESGSASG